MRRVVDRLRGDPRLRAAHALVFTWFQPALLSGIVLFWVCAPDRWATPKVIGTATTGFLMLCLGLERVNELHASWRLTWKEFATDLFHFGIFSTVSQFAYVELLFQALIAAVHPGAAVVHGAVGGAVPAAGAIHAPFVVQVLLILLVVDFAHYWVHRAMHNWYPLWATHASHHWITQLNTMKSWVTHPVSVYVNASAGLIARLWLARALHLDPRAAAAAAMVALTIDVYQHANIAFTPPRWWSFLFNTVEHHSLHHSRSYAAAQCNYATVFIVIDRVFGTYRDGSEEQVGQGEGRRLSIREQMVMPFAMLARWRRRPAGAV